MSVSAHGHDHALIRWLLCGLVVVGVHAGATLGVAYFSDREMAGIPDSAILLDLNPADASPPQGEQAETIPDQAKLEQPPEPEPPPENEEQKEPPPPDQPPPPPQVEPPPPPPQKQAEVTLPAPPPPRPVAKPPPKRMAAVHGAPSPRESAATAGARGDIKLAYARAVLAHINNHKVYPSTLKERGEVGKVGVSFVLSRSGRVVSARITSPSGHAALDREVLELVRRIQPFPVPPSQVVDRDLEFFTRLDYTLH